MIAVVDSFRLTLAYYSTREQLSVSVTLHLSVGDCSGGQFHQTLGNCSSGQFSSDTRDQLSVSVTLHLSGW